MSSSPFIFDGGNLALDFVNTRPMSDGARVERLSEPGDLDAWFSEAGVHPEGTVTDLSARLQERLLVDAHALRTALETCAEALRAEAPAPQAAVETINGILATDPHSIALQIDGPSFERVEVPHPVETSALLAPVARAAVELLTTAAPDRVDQCDDPECVLWYLDTTRNGRRRWCSMNRCGNRAKVAAHYRRTKARERE